MQNAQPVDLATLASIISECWGILLNVHVSVKYMFFGGLGASCDVCGLLL